MCPPEQSTSKYTIQFGSMQDSQVVIGDYNTVSQRLGLSPEDADALRAIFSDLRSTVTSATPEATRAEALAKTNDLEAALVTDRPDAGTVQRVLHWFREHAPQVAGAIVSVVINPLIGKLVEEAGTAIAEEFHQLLDDEIGPTAPSDL